MNLWLKSGLLLCLLLCGPGHAAELRTENTYHLADDEQAPAATLEDARWLAGNWKGTAFGQKFEANWSEPSAGSMVGYFKLYNDQGVSFYEILTLTVDNGTLSLKVKHFNEDFTAWEEKEDYINFRLVKLEDDALHFSGFSLYRKGDNAMDGYIVMRNGEDITEHHLVYSRN